MGFSELVGRAFKIHSLFKKCKTDIIRSTPDVIIFVDFSGFNIPMARWARKNGFQTVYYIPPKLWASRPWRIKSMKENIDFTIVTLPFELTYFKQKSIPVAFYGSPYEYQLRSATVDSKFKTKYQLDQKPIAAIIPGSRKQEIQKVLPTILDAARKFPQFNWCISCIGSLDMDIYKRHLTKSSGLTIHTIVDDHIQLLMNSHFAIVTSGTSTLESAILKVPQIVCYKTSRFNYLIARLMIQVQWISLPNLILGRTGVTELIQDELNPTRLEEEIYRLLNEDMRVKMSKDYQTIRNAIHGINPSKEAAEAIISLTR